MKRKNIKDYVLIHTNKISKVVIIIILGDKITGLKVLDKL